MQHTVNLWEYHGNVSTAGCQKCCITMNQLQRGASYATFSLQAAQAWLHCMHHHIEYFSSDSKQPIQWLYKQQLAFSSRWALDHTQPIHHCAICHDQTRSIRMIKAKGEMAMQPCAESCCMLSQEGLFLESRATCAVLKIGQSTFSLHVWQVSRQMIALQLKDAWQHYAYDYGSRMSRCDYIHPDSFIGHKFWCA